MPVRGIHLMAPSKSEVPTALNFIRGPLVEEGVNTLILEFDYNYNFQSRPEFANPTAPGRTEVRQLGPLPERSAVHQLAYRNCGEKAP